MIVTVQTLPVRVLVLMKVILIAVALTAIARPALAQPPAGPNAPSLAAGGEANLVLPICRSSIFGVNSRTLRWSARDLRARPRVRSGHGDPAQEPAGAFVDARGLRAILRNLQDLSHHAGQVHPRPVDVHRGHHRGAGWLSPVPGKPVGLTDRHPALQPHWHRRQLRRGLVRHPRQYVRELARRVRQPARQAVRDLRHSAVRGNEHRHVLISVELF